jgi:uncharacterized protein
MPIPLWRRIAEAICHLHIKREESLGTDVTTRIIWHGGEPFALPLSYFETLLREQRMAAERYALCSDRITTCVQTNLTLLTEPALRLIQEYDLHLGVSLDLIPGVRVDTLGRETESKVLANLNQLRDRQIPFGAITVLAKHTCPAICRIYDFWAAQGADFRVLPLFAGPPGRATETFEVTEQQLAGALCRLFEHRMNRADRISLAPLDEWLTVVVRKRMGGVTEVYDRRREGETVIVVRPNGDLFHTNEVGVPSFAWGSLAQSSLEEILTSPQYEASLRRSENITAAVCGDCVYRGACDSYPAHTERFSVKEGVRCPVAFQVFEYMNTWLDRRGLDSGRLQILAQRPVHEAARGAEYN